MTEEQIKIERILDTMQASRDYHFLMSMNGHRCGSKQMRQLLRMQVSQIASSEKDQWKKRRRTKKDGERTDN